MKKPKYTYSHCEIKAKDHYELCRKISRRLTLGERVLCYEAMGTPTNAGLYHYQVTIETLRD